MDGAPGQGLSRGSGGGVTAATVERGENSSKSKSLRATDSRRCSNVIGIERSRTKSKIGIFQTE
jgi:hypothetical protein